MWGLFLQRSRFKGRDPFVAANVRAGPGQIDAFDAGAEDSDPPASKPASSVADRVPPPTLRLRRGALELRTCVSPRMSTPARGP